MFNWKSKERSQARTDPLSSEQPLRSEIFSIDQLQQHAERLAAHHQVSSRRAGNLLLPRLSENEKALRAYNEATALVEKNRRITPAAEWLLDNFYLIEEQIRTARRHLPRGYSRELPHLAEGPSAGYPRVYDLALELIVHVDGRVDAPHLSSFVAAYQRVTNLKLGELWAIPIMLRLALIENLRRVAVLLSAARKERDAADRWADRMLDTAEKTPAKLIIVVAEMAQAEIALTRAFVAEFYRRLQEKTPTLQLATSWIEQRLAEDNLTIEQLVQSESQNQAANQVTVGNSITSLRFLDAMDWREFVETLSVVEQALRADPSGVYSDMDFSTRDAYRHAVERIAKYSRFSEREVAQKAIELTARNSSTSDHSPAEHVGFFLIGKGVLNLERALNMRRSARKIIGEIVHRFPLPVYLGAIVALTVAATVVLLDPVRAAGMSGWSLVLFSLLPALCVSHLAVALVNWFVPVFVPPRLLPRMDLSEGIPPEHSTMVVIPTMVTSVESVERLIEGIEIRYLANRDPQLYFALLTDFRDAPQEKMPEDEPLLRAAREGIVVLNEKYKSDRPSVFFLFHRPRRWNAQEGVWMGHERKRGKISEFNKFLRGSGRSFFSEIVGDTSTLPHIRYVITLDTDTQLPPEAARQLVGTIAHPLNRPRYDSAKDRVTDGYSILQPRVEVALVSASRSLFVKLFSGEPGLDPYTRAISDVYQDLFEEGSFIGKGIYDVDTFVQAVGERFPENRILSHDLLESAYARSALVSDVQLYEEYPSRYTADVSRRHRWIRGDWQIATWLLPRVPGPDLRRVANALSGLSRWKIFDNLRRSLVPLALTLLLVLSWTLPALPVGYWEVFVLVSIALPLVLSSLTDLARKPKELPWFIHFRGMGKPIARQTGQALFTFVFLPYDAFISLDAVLRSSVRLLFTRRHLLEWQTASDAERNGQTQMAAFCKAMWSAPAFSLALAMYLTYIRQDAFVRALPWLCIWFISPLIAWWISRPLAPEGPKLEIEQLQFLHEIARRTWRYFETFVGANDNWLPPDNFQEYPMPVVASRTSPTNIGMGLLANLAAYDFGYIPVRVLLERTASTLDVIEKLDRYRGHFYNWYDTRSLRPLLPLYVSTVDSGNLAGHLLILQEGLKEVSERQIFDLAVFEGLQTTLRILLAQAKIGKAAGAAQTAAEGFVAAEALKKLAQEQPTTLCGARTMLQRVLQSATELKKAAGQTNDSELQWWSNTLEQDSRQHLEELDFVAPWVSILAEDLQEQHRFQEISQKLDLIPTLRGVAAFPRSIVPALELFVSESSPSISPALRKSFHELKRLCLLASERASERMVLLEKLSERLYELAEMDFTFLYDPSRDLFAIGFNVTHHRMDSSYYDLLASEARLTSFVAIALGQLKQEHWFALGRLLTFQGGMPALISWSGSMFEYLMPLLVMPTYENTLLDASCKGAVARQIEYGRRRGVPWGFSESGYNLTDAQMTYQYRAFGVPGLGFKRGLAEDLVVAPYASVMALMVAPERACENLERLAADERLGRYGFYEAVDYTPSRLPPNQTSITVQSFMAHHQGMSLLALGYLLLDRPMQRRFERNPFFRATELLLQERVPKETSILYPHELEASGARRTEPAYEATMRLFTNPDLGAPEAHLLSNGRYHLMVTSAGGGYSRWKELSLTRWREDSTRDCWGVFLYLRDASTGEFWSVTHQPTLRLHQQYEAIFSQGRAEFRSRYQDIDAHSELCVSPEDDLEVRRVTLTNRSDQTRTLELTSYAEVVLNTPAADDAHPAFSNLFVQTQILPDRKAILCTRRPRSSHDQLPWMVHLMLLQGTEVGEASFETDRSRFLGRDRTPGAPAALRLTKPPAPLSNSAGSVLDPVVSIRRSIRFAPGETAQISLIIGLAPTREGAMSVVEKYQDQSLADRVIELAWTHSLVVLRHLNATEPDAQLYGRLASALLYSNPQRRANASILSQNRRGQSSLWSYGISGDLPILLVRNSNPERIDLVRQVLQAHSYWRLKGLTVDLVILNEVESVYRQSLHDQIMGLIASGMEAQLIDKPGGIFVRRLDQVSQEDRTLLQTAARVYLFDENGTLAEQLARRGRAEPLIPSLTPVRSRPAESREEMKLPYRELIFFNGLGGFTLDGREYVILLTPDQTTPAPWVNVLANEQFGSVVSETGSAYTWSENSHEFRLTPWYNDPVSDVSGEAFYIRDEQSGRFWSPTPYPARGGTPYMTRHGFGYTVFEHLEHGIASELSVYVAVDAPVKFAVLKLKNHSERVRQLSVTGYWEWVLGELRQKNAMHVVTEIDPAIGALFARNPYNTDFQDRVAFVDVNVATRTVTGDRTEFLGRNRSPANPASMGRARLSGKVGAGLDPCAALQAWFELGRGEEREIVFLMGVGKDREKAQQLIQRFRGAGRSREALERVWGYWGRTLGMVHFETPDPALNVLANGWLVYQVLACRLWGRTGFYQSGGAYGFRDQLQDVMALAHAEPGLFREHLLRCASHQFLEGDVQHWWHPPRNRGVRTHFSDDYLWLPFAVCYYVQRTRDTGVLDERIPFLEGRPVRPEEEAYYDLPQHSSETGMLYDHCVRAIEHGLRFGEHGLPLMGCGDWNDGMNRVGEHGKGESVWLAFFLYAVLNRFSDLAHERNDLEFAARCAKEATRLQENIERNAWDGQWYRRAYFDNGDPLGSASNPECQIDSLPQSWSIISGAGNPDRSRMAMDAVNARLVRRDWKLIQLFDPAFDSSPLEPGYIKGYVPGVRENGGQYTHGAVWTIMAFALMGDQERAWELFTLINPVRHGDTAAKIARYKVEPYVIAADVYGATPHISRGGWTWYTGSAGWMYRLILETFFGVSREGNKLRLTPRLPEKWKGAKVHYRYFETVYHITFTREAGQPSRQILTLDGTEQLETSFPLVDDRIDHQVIVRLI